MELTVDQALQKGIEAHKVGKVQEADRYYTAILKANHKHPDANHNMGVLAVGVGKIEASLPFFKTALEADTSVAQYWLSYIDALIKLDRMADAKAVFDEAKSKGAKGDDFDRLEQRLKSKQKSLQKAQYLTKEQLGSLINLLKQGQFKEALDKSSKLMEHLPFCASLININAAAYKGLGDIDTAIRGFKAALEIKPDFFEAYVNLGVAFRAKGELEDAIEIYNKAISMRSDNPQLYYNKGNVLQDQGKTEAAIRTYREALALKADYVEAINNMGVSLKDQGKLMEAIEAYQKVLTIKPMHYQAHYNLGDVYRESGDLAKAVEAYNKALSIKPDYAKAFINMGNALLDQGNLDEAIWSYNEALFLEPNNAEVLWNISGTSNNLGDAKKWLERCLNADPNHLRAKLTLGALHFYEGDKSNIKKLLNLPTKDHPFMRSFSWTFSLPSLPVLHFNRWAFFDYIVENSKQKRPFYEFGVWRGEAFRYLINTFKKGYGFDTFEGIPEDWHHEKAGTYSSEANIPQIEGGDFIVGKFEDTLPGFFSEPRQMASVINFDADLYSSTICALNFAKSVIDQHTILIFDEFIMNENWEQDEYKALNEFCFDNKFTYDVLAISFFTKQVAVKLLNI